jgi:hypothetical protein
VMALVRFYLMSLRTSKLFQNGFNERSFTQVDYAARFQSDEKRTTDPNSLEEHKDRSRMIGFKLKKLTETFNIKDNRLDFLMEPTESDNRNNFPDEYQYLILKELLYRDDLYGLLLRTKDSIKPRQALTELISPDNVYKLILIANSASETTKIFLNMLLTCRVIPPKAQKEIYDNLKQLYKAATTMCSIHDGQETTLSESARTSFLPAIFEFDILPLSYSKSAMTKEDHFHAFIEATWDLFPSIFYSVRFAWPAEISVWKLYAENLYASAKSPKFEGESWDSIVCRVAKKPDWVKSLLSLYAPTYLPGDSVARQELACFINTLVNMDQAQITSELVEVFDDHSDNGRKQQRLVSELVFAPISKSGKYIRQLDRLRKIRKSSVIREKNLLLAGYQGFISDSNYHVKFKDDYCEDIVNGLEEEEEDQHAWIRVLHDFFTCDKPPKSRLAYDALYLPVKRMFSAIQLTELNGDSYSLVLKTFLKVLQMHYAPTEEDWKLLSRSKYFQIHPEMFIDLLKAVNLEKVSESGRKELTIGLLNTKKLSSIHAFLVIRLLDSSKYPVELGLLILESVESDIKKFHSVPSIWNLLAVVAKKAHSLDVHEKILGSLSQSLQLRLKEKIGLNAAAMHEILNFIIDRSLCSIGANNKIYQSIEAELKNILGTYGKSFSECLYFRLMLFKINSSSTEVQDIFSYGFEANLFQLNRISPQSVSAKDFSKAFSQFVHSFEFGKSDDIKHTRSTINLIEFIKEFHMVPYFEDAQQRLLESMKTEYYTDAPFFPRLILLEAKKFSLSENQPIPDSVKTFISSAKYGFSYKDILLFDDKEIETYLLLRNEQQTVAEETAKICNRIFGSDSIKFISNLFFLFLNHDTLTDIYAVPMFTQLARLM